jgi:hypothetical protein
VHVGIVGGHAADGLLEEEADADDQVEAALGQLAQALLAIRVLARLELDGVDAELLLGPHEAAVGGVIEGAVPLATDVEDHADAQGRVRGRLVPRRAAAAGGEEGGGQDEDRRPERGQHGISSLRG